jgi:hypothetical protein
MRILSALVEGSDLTGNLDAPRLLTEQMQTALKVRVAFVGECISGDDSCFRLPAYCQDGKLLPQAEPSPLPETTAKEITRKLALFQDHVTHLANCLKIGTELQISANLQALRRDLAAVQESLG